MKVWWICSIKDINGRKLWLKKTNKIKGRFIACSHIWHVAISKCAYWLDTQSFKFWWKYINTNSAHFCNFFFVRHGTVILTCKNSVRNQKTATLGYTRIIYGTFSKSLPTEDDKQDSRITDKQIFHRFYESCFYLLVLNCL